MRLLVILLVLIPTLAFGDRIVLKSGKEYRGKFVSGDSGTVKFRVGSRTVRTFPAVDIARLEIGDKPAPDLPAKTPAATPMPARTPVATPPAAPPPTPVTVPETGNIKSTPLEGTSAVDSEYTRMGSESGPLGPPRAPQQPTADGKASVRFYTRGAIYWTSAAGAHAIHGPVFEAWMTQGGERSRLGYPTSDMDEKDGGFSRHQVFEGGSITWTQRDGAVVQYGGGQ